MAVLAADLELESKGTKQIRSFKVTADDCIYKGAMVAIDADGFALPCSDTAGLIFVGIAVKQADNTGGSDGDIYVDVYVSGCFKLTGANLAQTHVGRMVYSTDDQTINDAAATNDIPIGIMIEYLSATSAWIEIGLPTPTFTSAA